MGIWFAVTGATPTNHEHVADRRPDANLGYTEIVDVDFSGAERVLMDAGDLLVFDSHLMHCSSDNVSDGRRAAMVYHYARAGTVDHTYARLREQEDAMGEMPDDVKAAAVAGDEESPYIWMAVRRGGKAIGVT